MGSCYLCCAVTGLPIARGEQAVLLFLTPNRALAKLRFKDPTAQWHVASLPFFVNADDYQFSSMMPSEEVGEWQAKGVKQFTSNLAYKLLSPRVFPMPDNDNDTPDWSDMTIGKVGITDGLSHQAMMVKIKNGKQDEPCTRKDLDVRPLTYTAIRRDVWDFIQHRAGLRWRKYQVQTTKVFKREILTTPEKLEALRAKNKLDPVEKAYMESLRMSRNFSAVGEHFSRILLQDMCNSGKQTLLGVPVYVMKRSERLKAIKLMWQITALISYLDVLAKPLLPLLSMSPQETWQNQAMISEHLQLQELAKELLESKKAYWENEG